MRPRALLPLVASLLLVLPATASAQRAWSPEPDQQSGSVPYSEDPASGDGGGYQDGQPSPAPAPAPEPALPADPLRPTEPLPIAPKRFVRGEVAMLRTDGKAAIPTAAPKAVRNLIAAANAIVGKPYKWGGGHRRLVDRGYDCSGTVSYALIGAGLLNGPLVSGGFNRWQSKGPGRWVTTYSNKGHVYLEVAGLRLDTSAVGDARGGKGPRWRPVIGARKGFHVRHPTGL